MIWSRIDASERNRVLRRVGPPIDSYETYWQASGLLRTWEPEAITEATRLLDIHTAGPDYAEGVAALTQRRPPNFP